MQLSLFGVLSPSALRHDSCNPARAPPSGAPPPQMSSSVPASLPALAESCSCAVKAAAEGVCSDSPMAAECLQLIL